MQTFLISVFNICFDTCASARDDDDYDGFKVDSVGSPTGSEFYFFVFFFRISQLVRQHKNNHVARHAAYVCKRFKVPINHFQIKWKNH
jgi:hypothetical protein